MELVEAQIRLLTDTKAIVIEGFPRNQEQLESFNKMVIMLQLPFFMHAPSYCYSPCGVVELSAHNMYTPLIILP